MKLTQHDEVVIKTVEKHVDQKTIPRFVHPHLLNLISADSSLIAARFAVEYVTKTKPRNDRARSEYKLQMSIVHSCHKAIIEQV